MLSSTQELEKYQETPVEFWTNVFDLKNCLNQQLFPNLSKLVSALLSLPHSSAAAERIFSQLNLIKNKLRNRLSVKTCNALIFTKQLLGKNQCYTFNPSEELLSYNVNANEEGVSDENLTF